MAIRVLLKTALTPFTGYGQDGIGLATALSQAGYDVTLSPTSVEPPLPGPVAALLTRPIEPPFDLLLNHADPQSLGLSPGERRSAHVTMAWTMWEFTGMGEGFNEPFGRPDDKRLLADWLDTYDVVGVYDEVSRQALTPHLRDQKVVKLQGGYWADDWISEPDERDWSGTFRFAMHGQLHQRKNPFVSIEAFNKLKQLHGDDFDAELHLKNNLRTLHPAMEQAYPGVKIHYVTWSKRQLKDFYLSCHCFLAPSWGEGKNLPALEAQTTGMPVIATKFGGHEEWMGDDWSYAVGYTLAEHAAGMGSARADVDDLAEKMWYVYSNREEARRKGELASRVIPSMLDWSKVVERLRSTLAGSRVM